MASWSSETSHCQATRFGGSQPTLGSLPSHTRAILRQSIVIFCGSQIDLNTAYKQSDHSGTPTAALSVASTATCYSTRSSCLPAAAVARRSATSPPPMTRCPCSDKLSSAGSLPSTPSRARCTRWCIRTQLRGVRCSSCTSDRQVPSSDGRKSRRLANAPRRLWRWNRWQRVSVRRASAATVFSTRRSCVPSHTSSTRCFCDTPSRGRTGRTTWSCSTTWRLHTELLPRRTTTPPPPGYECCTARRYAVRCHLTRRSRADCHLLRTSGRRAVRWERAITACGRARTTSALASGGTRRFL